ncbi:MAG: hypothetical protein ACLQU2_36815, partial [Candidatus Binataceae bacterium]
LDRAVMKGLFVSRRSCKNASSPAAADETRAQSSLRWATSRCAGAATRRQPPFDISKAIRLLK